MIERKEKIVKYENDKEWMEEVDDGVVDNEGTKWGEHDKWADKGVKVIEILLKETTTNRLTVMERKEKKERKHE